MPGEEDAVGKKIKKVFSPYEDPVRTYHNLSHLNELAEKIDISGKTLISPWSELETEVLYWSILFHDVVYFPGNPDNEMKSAEYWLEFSQNLLIPDTIRYPVEIIILSTKTHEIPKNVCEENFMGKEPIIPRFDFLLKTFLDADRSILGALPEKYLEYTKQIRLEYIAFQDKIFKTGRKIFLESMLQRIEIFYTPFFKDEYEVQARKNMESELLSI